MNTYKYTKYVTTLADACIIKKTVHIDSTTLSYSTERTSGLTFYDAMRVYHK